jgi:hypothetical protein
MPDEPKKIFDLMDTETEPTDEQLEELMRYVGEAVRARKMAVAESPVVAEKPSRPYGNSGGQEA